VLNPKHQPTEFSMPIPQQIERLRARAANGDQSAVREFERRFAGPVRRLVRRVLKLNRAETPLERGIMHEAQRQRTTHANAPSDGEQLISLVTRRLCEAVFARPASRTDPLLATVRLAWSIDTETVRGAV
jgi:hypothetical protein